MLCRISAARRHMTFANVMSVLAVFIALGGASYAAINLPKNSVGTKQLKGKSVGTKQLKGNAVNSNKVKNFSLRANDFKKGQIPSGPTGPVGEQGPPGPSTGPAGGDLTGNYPDPLIGSSKVDSLNVVDNSLTGSDVNEGTLGKVPDAEEATTANGVRPLSVSWTPKNADEKRVLIDEAGIRITAWCQDTGGPITRVEVTGPGVVLLPNFTPPQTVPGVSWEVETSFVVESAAAIGQISWWPENGSGVTGRLDAAVGPLSTGAKCAIHGHFFVG